jgi:hypothetical protein
VVVIATLFVVPFLPTEARLAELGRRRAELGSESPEEWFKAAPFPESGVLLPGGIHLGSLDSWDGRASHL